MLTPREQLADTLKQARVEAGYATHGALAKRLNVSRPVVTRAENPSHPAPSDAVLAAWAGVTGIGLDTLTDLAARSKSGTPDWFVPYAVAERNATMLRCWGVTIVPGLLQVEAYACAVLSVYPHAPERLRELISARLERQRVLERAYLVAVIDSAALARGIGSPTVMAEQLSRLVTVAERANIALHVVPETANTGVWAALDIATHGAAATVCLTTALDDVTSTAPDQIDSAMQAFERVMGAAMTADDSLDCLRTWEGRWKERI